jgi:tetratricopeptide (TPR) repeat protein
MSHRLYEQAETLEDVRPGLNVVRILLKLGRFQEAVDTYRGDLAEAMTYNLDASDEILSLLRPFFSEGWGKPQKTLDKDQQSYLTNDAALALLDMHAVNDSVVANNASIQINLEVENWNNVTNSLHVASVILLKQSIAKAFRASILALEISTLLNNTENIFASRLWLFCRQALAGQWREAELTWQLLDPMGRAWSRARHRPGMAECEFARFRHMKGDLKEEHLALAERLAAKGKNRPTLRALHWLRGIWRLDQGEWVLAVVSLQEVVRMDRERGYFDAQSETALALAKFHLGQFAEPMREAGRLAQLRDPAHRYLAQLWLALGDTEQAKHHALAAYTWAWADGEPYVRRQALTKATELLQQMSVPIPNLPPYDPANDKPLPWEADVRTAIQEIRARLNNKH